MHFYPILWGLLFFTPTFSWNTPLYPLGADQIATVSVMEIQAGFSAGARAEPMKNAWESHQSTLAADMQGESDE